jgi:hypothetical protein
MVGWFKMKTLLLLSLLFSIVFADFEYKVENANLTVSSKDLTYNYDRLRFRGDFFQNDFFVTIIGDGVSYYGQDYLDSSEYMYVRNIHSDTPFKTQTAFREYDNMSTYAKLYRLYGGYEDSDNRIVVGLQNISMGVGRIWNPTNLLNPRNIYALEPDETFGIATLLYTRHINDTSDFTIIVSQKEDDTFKYAARYKAFLDFSDIAIDALSSKNTKMLGLELEANLADTGIEVRLETAYIENKLRDTLYDKQDTQFIQTVVGFDDAFVNGVTLVMEALYSSKRFTSEQMYLNLDSEILPNLVYSKFYTALLLSYDFNIFLDGSVSYIESYNDENSRFIAPTLSYTFNDYNKFTLGSQLQGGSTKSEFGPLENRYFFKYTLSF